MPSSKPFVSPEALAASTASATAQTVHNGGVGTLNEQVSTLVLYSLLPYSPHSDTVSKPCGAQMYLLIHSAAILRAFVMS